MLGASWVATNAPGMVDRASPAWSRHAHAETPVKSASFTSAWRGQALDTTERSNA